MRNRIYLATLLVEILQVEPELNQMKSSQALKIENHHPVRRATSADIPAILDLINSFPGTLLPRTTEDMLELIDLFWVVDGEGEILGCCCLEVYSPKIAEIRSVAVRASHHRIGIGESLVLEAVAEAQKRKIKQILVVTSAREFFEKLNFGECLNEKFALFYNG